MLCSLLWWVQFKMQDFQSKMTFWDVHCCLLNIYIYFFTLRNAMKWLQKVVFFTFQWSHWLCNSAACICLIYISGIEAAPKIGDILHLLAHLLIFFCFFLFWQTSAREVTNSHTQECNCRVQIRYKRNNHQNIKYYIINIPHLTRPPLKKAYISDPA